MCLLPARTVGSFPPSVLGNRMQAMIDFFQTTAAFVSLALLLYCASRLRRIERNSEAIRYLLFRDYEQDLDNRGVRPLL